MVKKKTIQIPEDIGTTMFESGVLRPFSPIIEPILGSIEADTPAEKAGLQEGDKFLKLNGKEIQYWSDFQALKAADSTNSALQLTYIRGGQENTISITPDEDGVIGVYPKIDYTVQHTEYSFAKSITKGFDFGYWDTA